MKIDGSGETVASYLSLGARGAPPSTPPTAGDVSVRTVSAVGTPPATGNDAPRVRVDVHVVDPAGAQAAAAVERSTSYIESFARMLDEGGVVFPRSTIDRSLSYLALSGTPAPSSTLPRTISLDGGSAARARFNVLA